MNLYKCTLLEKPVDEGECYDIQMVRAHFIKPTILEEPLDTEKENIPCDYCPFNPLPNLTK